MVEGAIRRLSRIGLPRDFDLSVSHLAIACLRSLAGEGGWRRRPGKRIELALGPRTVGRMGRQVEAWKEHDESVDHQFTTEGTTSRRSLPNATRTE